MEPLRDIIVIGGGPAGLTSAIHLASSGRRVLVIEKDHYPRDKVCGEYVSNEVLPYLNYLGIQFEKFDLPQITRFQLSTFSGSVIEAELPVGGFGISRYALDNLLYERAVDIGVEFSFEEVTDISFTGEQFIINTNSKVHHSKICIGAFGRSPIEHKRTRKLRTESRWMAIKAHYKCEFPTNTVALHNFRGGYCSISAVEGNAVNICCVTRTNSFNKRGSFEGFRERILFRNGQLKSILSIAEIISEKQLIISDIDFNAKTPIDCHTIMVGDSAGLLHPLCGNGMAMAFHSAKFAAENILLFLNSKISREEMESRYEIEWNRKFRRSLRNGKILSAIMFRPFISRMVLRGFSNFPFLLPGIISSTHGNPITLEGIDI